MSAGGRRECRACIKEAFLKLLTKEKRLIHYVNQSSPLLIPRVPAGGTGNQLGFDVLVLAAFHVRMLISSCWFSFVATLVEG